MSQLLNWMKNDDYGFCHDIEGQVVKVLDKPGRQLFIRHFEQLVESAIPRQSAGSAEAILEYENSLRLVNPTATSPASKRNSTRGEPCVNFFAGIQHPYFPFLDSSLPAALLRLKPFAIVLGSTPDCPAELEEAFLENVLALESHDFVRPFDALV